MPGEEGVAEPRGRRRRHPPRTQPVEQPAGVALERRPTPILVEVDVAEAHEGRQGKTRGVAAEVIGELRVGEDVGTGPRPREEPHLRHDVPSHHRVGAIEADLQRFGVEVAARGVGFAFVAGLEESHVLLQPRAYRLGIVEPAADRLAVEDLFLDQPRDEPRLVRGCGPAQRVLLETLAQAPDLLGGDGDQVGIGGGRSGLGASP